VQSFVPYLLLLGAFVAKPFFFPVISGRLNLNHFPPTAFADAVCRSGKSSVVVNLGAGLACEVLKAMHRGCLRNAGWMVKVSPHRSRSFLEKLNQDWSSIISS
jgi:hypothetical protein